MKRIYYEIYLKAVPALILILFFSQAGLAGSKIKSPQENPIKVFSLIETSINSGDVSAISKFISSQTYISLSNGETGYYSSVQSYYIIQDFFKNYKVVSFKFRSVSDADNPYGIGTLVYEFRNKRVTAQVFVSLSETGNDWLISQFTVK